MIPFRRVARVEARLHRYRWCWAEENAAFVAAHWSERKRRQPAIFNGRILMVSGLTDGPDLVRADFFETDYANLLAWIDTGFPGDPVWNAFAMGALRGAEGGFVLGRMGLHTANAGRLYFPCGTPDPSDLTPDGSVDLAGSLTRELEEETGLGPGDLAVQPGWIVVADRGYLAFMQVVQLGMDSAAACRRIRAHLARETRPELDGVEVIANPDRIEDEAIPPVVQAFLRDAFAGRSPHS